MASIPTLCNSSVAVNSKVVLGTGSYGQVCLARIGQLPCAAKLLHNTLFDSNDPGSSVILQRFVQECEFLSTIHHPNVIQYLGTVKDSQSERPTLLMELMDESLTDFLERQKDPLPYHSQLNICYDVALALSHLHSNGIIHRDLSSNNILLIGDGIRAKVTDFGMSRLADINRHSSSWTQVPGTEAYMPPEALTKPPKYSNKLDCFSHGVLAVQIITRKFPKPGDAHVAVQNFLFSGLKQIPEEQRRKEDINLIEANHPLLPVALASIKDKEKQRISADEICKRLKLLREGPKYVKSVGLSKQRIEILQKEVNSLHIEKEKLEHSKEQEIKTLQKEVDTLRMAKVKLETELKESNSELEGRNHTIEVLCAEKKELRNKICGMMDEFICEDHLRLKPKRNQPKENQPKETHKHVGGPAYYKPAGQDKSSIDILPDYPAVLTPVDASLGLTEGSMIQLSTSDSHNPVRYYGVIKWIGVLPNVKGRIAGIELDEFMEGCADGTYLTTKQKFFNCPYGKGLYYPLANLLPDERYAPAVAADENPLKYVSEEEDTAPIDLPLEGYIGDEKGIQGHHFLHPIVYHIATPPAIHNKVLHPTVATPVDASLGLTEGSMIQLSTSDSHNPVRYGVIKWIGVLSGVKGRIAGIELDEFMEGCTDGTYPQTKQKFFNCSYGKGLYYPLANLLPDERNAPAVAADGNPLKHVSEVEEMAPVYLPLENYVGDEKGIQGHQNSCYLDATLFGLFALTHDFDDMFLQNAESSTIGKILWKSIVNPLRKNGVVKYECVMELREHLDQLGKMKGITQDEKDPEEFLNLMFKHTLRVEPFISIRRPFGVEKEYFVRLFLDMDEAQKSPSIADLMDKMFAEQNISFTEVPSKLLIQVPRFGKKFKTFQKVIPARTMNVAKNVDLKNPLTCYNCQEAAHKICHECTVGYGESVPAFCDRCLDLIHKKARRNHRWEWSREMQNLMGLAEFELLSVICIETSHYVCFVREDDRWIFFNSMANRVYDKYNIPKVVDCTDVLNEWVYPENHNLTRLLQTPPRELPEYVRRFTQDIYMCVYIQPMFK